MTLPLALRNPLAELIVRGFHDAGARAGLAALSALREARLTSDDARALPDGVAAALFERAADGWAVRAEWQPHAAELAERARRAWRALRDRPIDAPTPPLAIALEEAAVLFDARLYFEAHELLEPCWVRATGAERAAVQGLIQIAVGLQHLANGNVAGARALLGDGIDKLHGRPISQLDLEAFARALEPCLVAVVQLGSEAATRFDWQGVPPFPTAGRPSRCDPSGLLSKRITS